MGLLDAKDWQAKWIGYDAAYQASAEAAADDQLMNIQGLKWVQVKGGKDGSKSCLRRRIELPEGREVRRAVLALYAYHFCEAAVNGVPVGQAMHWDRTARLDVGKALHSGINVVTLVASHSDPYNPAVIGRLVLQFESGEDLIIPIDDKWKASQQAADGWEAPAFDDTGWSAAEVIDGTPWHGPEAVADVGACRRLTSEKVSPLASPSNGPWFMSLRLGSMSCTSMASPSATMCLRRAGRSSTSAFITRLMM